jgi:DNA-binding XRE family transcriptional regulator
MEMLRGRDLRHERVQAGQSQAMVADALGIGRSTLADVEHERVVAAHDWLAAAVQKVREQCAPG